MEQKYYNLDFGREVDFMDAVFLPSVSGTFLAIAKMFWNFPRCVTEGKARRKETDSAKKEK